MSNINPLSNDYFSTVSNKWMAINDLRASLQRAKSLSTQHSNLLAKLEGQIKSHADSIEASAKYLNAAERSTVITRAVAAKRHELVNGSSPERIDLLRKIDAEDAAIMAASIHYDSAVQILMRSSIGSEKRTLIAGQIAQAGNAELLSLAHLAAATNDQAMGAALVSRVSTIPPGKRPFSSQSLANVLVGETLAEAQLIFGEMEALLVGALATGKAFETGQIDTLGKIKAALLKRNNAEKQARLAVARGVEPDPVERISVQLDKDKPTSFKIQGTTLPDGKGVPETPAGAEARGNG
ncbi:hypothetical protein C9413_27895 [Rhizobium sp. SEMIA 4085]|uniref:Uncharacterized protein n=1 Tax=Rhizobium gallicum bv. gallicum R602sp TaxID=1041138 RepID=A0A0B4XAD8_9HYPH|nr:MULTISPECIES: hypothetical protein [Rhizobium]AJD43578.1 hypothetical protein RGR602_PB00037 [Rhizobium gallicum bv. gallicum R602sp]NNH33113.1 hypothetical protein [Rhizobium sp. SEMIA 4085]TDW34075.1 hypothetical protein EV128_10482 [Rhizobium azibense]